MSTGAVPNPVAAAFRAVRRVLRQFESERNTTGDHFSATWKPLEFRTEPDKLDGGWVAFCSDLPGCAGQGETEEEALRDAAAAAVAIIQLRVDRALQEYSEVESAKRLHKMSVAL